MEQTVKTGKSKVSKSNQNLANWEIHLHDGVHLQPKGKNCSVNANQTNWKVKDDAGKKTEKIMKERKPKKDDVGKEKKKQVKKHRKEQL